MKKIIAILLSIILVISISACEIDNSGPKDYTTQTGFIEISGKDNLYYDPETKVVYIIFNESYYKGYGYMSPYYAPNGFPYIYDANLQELIEISR